MASAFAEEKAEQAVEGAAEDVADKLEQHGEAFVGFLADVQANVLNSISAQSVGPVGFVENFEGETRRTLHPSSGPHM